MQAVFMNAQFDHLLCVLKEKLTALTYAEEEGTEEKRDDEDARVAEGNTFDSYSSEKITEHEHRENNEQ